MSEFFESEIVQEELDDINELQKIVYSQVFSFSSLSRDDKIEHVGLLTELLEKQRILYTRLTLSDDPKAVVMRKQIQDSVVLMGFPGGTDIHTLFDGMKDAISKLKQSVD